MRYLSLFCKLALLAGCLVIGGDLLFAQEQTWNNSAGGNYSNAANWTPVGVPDTSGESARFNLSDDYTVTHAAGTTSVVDNLSIVAGQVTFATASPGAATYQVDDTVRLLGGDLRLDPAGASNLQLLAGDLKVGGNSSLLADHGAITTVLNNLTVGDFLSDTPGSIVIQGGATLNVGTLSGHQLTLGFHSTVAPTPSQLTLQGAGSSLHAASEVQTHLGFNTPALLQVLDGSEFHSPDGLLDIARQPGGVASGSKLVIEGGSTVSLVDSDDGSYGTTRIAESATSAGMIEVRGGSRFEAGNLSARGLSTLVVEGIGTSLLANELHLQESSTLTLQGGALLQLPSFANDDLSGQAKLTLTGVGTRWLANTTLSLEGVSPAQPTQINLLAGATAQPDATLANTNFSLNLSNNSVVNVSGSGSTLDAGTGTIQLKGTAGTEGKLLITDGGQVLATHLNVGVSASDTGRLRVEVGSLTVASHAQLGATFSNGILTDQGAAMVDLLPSSLLHVQGNLVLGSQASLQLSGGELRLTNLTNIHAVTSNTLLWGNGTVAAQNDSLLSTSTAQLLMPSGKLVAGQTLRVEGNLNLQSVLVVDGGTLAVEGLTDPTQLQLQSGTLHWLASHLAIQTGGPLGDSIHLATNTTLRAAQITNAGTVSGDGTLDALFTNQSTGTLRIDSGDHLRIVTGLTHANHGSLQLQGGLVDFSGTLTNESTGNIVGRGTLSTAAGLVNQGKLTLSSGTTDLFGDVTNQAAGQVIISGNANVTFWDDVAHTGATFHVSPGSTVTFFGAAGFGISGDTSQVFFEADIIPGESPGLSSFGGSVHLGSGAHLQIELAGTDRGTEYDALDIARAATISGQLTVSLLNGFAPSLGDTFEFVTAVESLTGTFANESLPNLGSLLKMQTFYSPNAVMLAVIPSLTGDYNADGTVDAADYTAWRDLLGQTGIGLPADGDLSGTVDLADYNLWKTNFGMTTPAILKAATVPEPSSLLLLALGLVATVRFRKDRSRVKRLPLEPQMQPAVEHVG